MQRNNYFLELTLSGGFLQKRNKDIVFSQFTIMVDISSEFTLGKKKKFFHSTLNNSFFAKKKQIIWFFDF